MTLQRPVVVMKLQWLVVLAALFLGLGIPDSRAVGQGLEIPDPLSGQDVTRIVQQLYASPPEITRRSREIGEGRQ